MQDKWDKTNGSVEDKDILIPPTERIKPGWGGFKVIGETFFQYFIELCDLKPNEKILDVGCGIGRMAVPLTKYLNKEGSYEGFDILPDGIDWCKEEITSRYTNFNFHVSDVLNEAYNKNGTKASEYRFPYEDESFDFVFLTSVFTHLAPQDMENYFCEIVRVLKNKGRSLITFFLLNETSLRLISAGESRMSFEYRFGEHCRGNTAKLENAAAYNEEFVISLYHKYGMKIRYPVRYGSWSSRSDFLSYQDIIIAEK